MLRPAVDVVVPFAGPREALEQLAHSLASLGLAPGDSIVIVDNTPGRERSTREEGGIPVLHASERRSPGYARNRGAALGTADWLLFLDADTDPPQDLLARYFDPAPRPRTGVLAGGIRDEPASKSGPPAARYAYIREAMSQQDTFRFGDWGFPKTANAAFRREAFEQVGGFREDIRTAEDADLSYRLRAAGWEIERREAAVVTHRNRATLRSFVHQRALYGAGGAWLERQYPGSFPARRRPGLLWWAVRQATRGLLAAAVERDRDRAVWAVFNPLELVVWELGRSLPNERPLNAATWWRALTRLRGVRGAARV